MIPNNFTPIAINKHFRVFPNKKVISSFNGGNTIIGRVVDIKEARYNSPHAEDKVLVIANEAGNISEREAKYCKCYYAAIA